MDVGGKYVPTCLQLIVRLKYFFRLQNCRCIPNVLSRHEQGKREIFITAEIFVLRNTANCCNRNSHPESKKQINRNAD